LFTAELSGRTGSVVVGVALVAGVSPPPMAGLETVVRPSASFVVVVFEFGRGVGLVVVGLGVVVSAQPSKVSEAAVTVIHRYVRMRYSLQDSRNSDGS
jgi:hypothetical protein